MKWYITAAVVMLLLLGHSAAEAKIIETLTQNEFMTAESIDAGMTQTGAHFTLGEGYQSFYPAFRFGAGAFVEFGLRAGVTSADVGAKDKLATLVGGDIKYQLVKQTEGVPVDMAVDLGFDNHFLSGKNVSELTFSVLFSRSFPLIDRGYKLTPYGGLELSSLYGSYLKDNETDFYLFGGLEWKLSQKSMFYLELKAGDNILGGIGVRFEY
ncbi:MAG: hypothetical protein OEW15_10415 [Nitrospirota bacterium]|nr:hypothetical protein [Nitrospirota bacterium]